MPRKYSGDSRGRYTGIPLFAYVAYYQLSLGIDGIGPSYLLMR